MSATVALRVSLATLVLAAAAGALAFFVAPRLLGDVATPASAEPVAAPTPVVRELPNRVLNLKPGGEFRYLKINIAIELEMPPAAADEDARAALDVQIAERLAVLEDGINSAITARQSDVLGTPDGKAGLKAEIQRMAAEALGLPVSNVFFTQFVMQ
jgi:flagellar basal body-associated protein FliL